MEESRQHSRYVIVMVLDMIVIITGMSPQAYQDAVKKASGLLPSLPALTKYTNDQLFFMQFGQVKRE